MVRIKHRYLLVHILNPDPLRSKSQIVSPADKALPDLVQFHGPSPDDLTPQIFVGAIKDQVQYLYGDYGLGLVSSSLVGISLPSTIISSIILIQPTTSQIPLSSNLNSHRSLLAKPLPSCVGSSIIHDTAAGYT